MKKVFIWLLTVALATGLAGTAAWATPPAENAPVRAQGQDNVTPNPLAEKQAALREEALEQTIKAQARGDARSLAGSKVAELAPDQYVELAREDTDRIFTLLVEFDGNKGPLHNEIPRPDRSQDNTTIWKSDFDREHYENLFFNTQEDAISMANYYDEQSSGRYTVEGDVTDWVRLDANEAEYGANTCGDVICENVWGMVRDGLGQWVADQRAQGQTDAQIRQYLTRFDEWDRYDYDNDGNFDERDGYIDHFQIVHAGEGEETGGGAQGENAIWSHRWYANYQAIGQTGPNQYAKQGGYSFPGMGIWVGDYTTEPENGGLGVFAHEFGHDLDLPDEYDTTYTGEASSAFWTLMSSGSYLNDGRVDLGTKPGHMNAWDKLQLGWLNYGVAQAGEESTHRLGPAEFNTDAAQGLITLLPDRRRTIEVNEPYAGDYEWWSGSGNNLENTLTRAVNLERGFPARVEMKAWYRIERGYDYLYAEVSTDGGKRWAAIPGRVNGETIGTDGQRPALSGSSRGKWVDLSYGLSRYAGEKIRFRLRYLTDAAVAPKGFTADRIRITSGGQTIFSDGAENGNNGWTVDGFRRITGSFTDDYANYYVAENRQYLGFDESLETGPYNFVTDTYAERFPYQNGLLVSYWDTFYSDNDVGQHPGGGLILPIDAHPRPLLNLDGDPWRTRIQVYDAPFGTEPTDSISLTTSGGAQRSPSLPPDRTFNDNDQYWYSSDPDAGVKVPHTSTIIQVGSSSADGEFMRVKVRPAR